MDANVNNIIDFVNSLGVTQDDIANLENGNASLNNPKAFLAKVISDHSSFEGAVQKALEDRGLEEGTDAYDVEYTQAMRFATTGMLNFGWETDDHGYVSPEEWANESNGLPFMQGGGDEYAIKARLDVIVRDTFEVFGPNGTEAKRDTHMQVHLGALPGASAAAPVAPSAEDDVTAETAAPTEKSGTPYLVKKDDNIAQIASDFYNIKRGDFETKAEYIAALEKAVEHVVEANPTLRDPNGKIYELAVGKNATSIFDGQTLVLPDKEDLSKESSVDLKLAELTKKVAIEYPSASRAAFFDATGASPAAAPAAAAPTMRPAPRPEELVAGF